MLCCCPISIEWCKWVVVWRSWLSLCKLWNISDCGLVQVFSVLYIYMVAESWSGVSFMTSWFLHKMEDHSDILHSLVMLVQELWISRIFSPQVSSSCFSDKYSEASIQWQPPGIQTIPTESLYLLDQTSLNEQCFSPVVSPTRAKYQSQITWERSSLICWSATVNTCS